MASKLKCQACEGTGTIPDGFDTIYRKPCPYCDGTGIQRSIPDTTNEQPVASEAAPRSHPTCGHINPLTAEDDITYCAVCGKAWELTVTASEPSPQPDSLIITLDDAREQAATPTITEDNPQVEALKSMLQDWKARAIEAEAQLADAKGARNDYRARAEKAEAEAAAMRSVLLDIADVPDPDRSGTWEGDRDRFRSKFHHVKGMAISELETTTAGAKLLDELQALRAAAQPFAALGQSMLSNPPTRKPGTIWGHDQVFITLDDFEALLAALKGTDAK